MNNNEKPNFETEASDGSKAIPETSTGESAETDSLDPPAPTDLSEPSDFSSESESEKPSELPKLADETAELEIDVQR